MGRTPTRLRSVGPARFRVGGILLADTEPGNRVEAILYGAAQFHGSATATVAPIETAAEGESTRGKRGGRKKLAACHEKAYRQHQHAVSLMSESHPTDRAAHDWTEERLEKSDDDLGCHCALVLVYDGRRLTTRDIRGRLARLTEDRSHDDDRCGVAAESGANGRQDRRGAARLLRATYLQA